MLQWIVLKRMIGERIERNILCCSLLSVSTAGMGSNRGVGKERRIA